MDRITLSVSVFETLVKHLVEIEEARNQLLEQYFPGPSKERYETESLLDTYIEHIDALIRHADQSQITGNTVPFVTIGSQVCVQDMTDGDTLAYRIVSPFNGQTRAAQGIISYLSPIGRALLLKKVGDIAQITVPAGIIRYKILLIQIPQEPEEAS